VVQNQVGAEAYGSYFALFNFALILNIFLDLGTSNFNNRNVSQNQQILGKYFPRIVALRFLLAIGYFLICLASAFLLNYSEAQLWILGLLSFNQFLLSGILFLRSNIAALQLFRTDSLISVLDRLLMIATCGMVLWGFEKTEPFQIEWFIYLQTFSYTITAIIAAAVVLKKGGPFAMNWNPKMQILILKKSLPFAFLILLMSIYGRVDSVLLERLLPDGKIQTGIYAQAFRLLDACNMIAYLFAVLLLPMFSRMLKLKQDVRPLVRLSAKLILIPTFTLAMVCFYHANELMGLLYEQHISDSGKILSLLMFSLIPMAGAYIIGTLLTANNSLKQLNFIAVIGVISSFTFNFILIPKFGAFGAGVTCLGTQLLSFSLQLIVAVKLFHFKLNFRILHFILPMVLVALSAYFSAALNWMLAASLVLISGGVLTLVSLLPDIGTFKRLKMP